MRWLSWGISNMAPIDVSFTKLFGTMLGTMGAFAYQLADGKSAVESLGAAATRLVFPEGETVLQAGEGADTFYILIDGKVNVSPDGATLKSGDTWGEEVLTEPTPSSSTLVAAEERKR